jgi:hypothetical protein
MSKESISQEEKKAIQAMYGMPLEQLDLEQFEKLHKGLRAKYHPDRFEKYDDALVKELAKEKFQILEDLGEKIRHHLQAGGNQAIDLNVHEFGEGAVFAFDNMKIEILTREKDLKYRLFGAKVRWLEKGDKFKIPQTSAHLVIDNYHRGSSIGFVESVPLFLTFGPDDDLAEIATWLYQRIVGQAKALIIEGKRIPVDLQEMLAVIRRKSFLRLGKG